MDFLIPVIVTVIILIIAVSKKGSRVQVSDSARLTPIITSLSMDKAFDTVLEFARYNGYAIDTNEKGSRRIVLGQGAGLLSYGNFYPIQVKSRSDGKTIVEVGIRAKMGSQSQGNFALSKDHERCVEGIRAHLAAAE